MVQPKITFALLPPFCPHMQPCPSERIIRRFTAQTTDYQRLLSTFAEGLYTEVSWLLPATCPVRLSTQRGRGAAG